jgi:hypothetical protein
MPQYWATRKNQKHYLSCVVSNKPDKYFWATLVYVTLSVIYPAMCRVHRLDCVLLLLIGNTTQRRTDKDGVKSVICGTLSTERRRPERNSRRCGSETAPESGSLFRAASYFTSSETPPCRQAAPATARCHCGRSQPPCPPSRRPFAPPEKAAASPMGAAPDRRRPASGHNPCAR